MSIAYGAASLQMPAATCALQGHRSCPYGEQLCCTSPACSPSVVESANQASGASTNATEQAAVVCRVVGCSKSIVGLKEYYAKRKVCQGCMKEDSVVLADQPEQGPQRFCHQCGKFQSLTEFDINRRSCRTALERRRRPPMRASSFKHNQLELGWENLPAMAGRLETLLRSGCQLTQAPAAANPAYYSQLLQLVRQEHQQQLAATAAAGMAAATPFSQAALLQSLSQQLQQLDPKQQPNPLATAETTIMSSTPLHPGWNAPAVTRPAAGKVRRAPVKSRSCSTLLSCPGGLFTSAAAAASALRRAQVRSRSSTPEVLPVIPAAAALQELSLVNSLQQQQQQHTNMHNHCNSSQPGNQPVSASSQGTCTVEQQLHQLRQRQQQQQQQHSYSSTPTSAPVPAAIPTINGAHHLAASVADAATAGAAADGKDGPGSTVWAAGDAGTLQGTNGEEEEDAEAWLDEIMALGCFSNNEAEGLEVTVTDPITTASKGEAVAAAEESGLGPGLTLQQQLQDELGISSGGGTQSAGGECERGRSPQSLLALNKMEELQQQMMVMQRQLSLMRAQALGALAAAAK